MAHRKKTPTRVSFFMASGPVSYTHLDVYKRQLQKRPAVQAHLPIKMAFSLPRSCFVEKSSRQRPVSYTHLDVYKRQDKTITMPYKDNLQSLLHEPSFRFAVDRNVWSVLPSIVKAGNLAVHTGHSVSAADAVFSPVSYTHLKSW